VFFDGDINSVSINIVLRSKYTTDIYILFFEKEFVIYDVLEYVDLQKLLTPSGKCRRK